MRDESAFMDGLKSPTTAGTRVTIWSLMKSSVVLWSVNIGTESKKLHDEEGKTWECIKRLCLWRSFPDPWCSWDWRFSRASGCASSWTALKRCWGRGSRSLRQITTPATPTTTPATLLTSYTLPPTSSARRGWRWGPGGLIPIPYFPPFFFFFLLSFSTPSSTHREMLGKVARKRNEDWEIENVNWANGMSLKHQFKATSVTYMNGRWGEVDAQVDHFPNAILGCAEKNTCCKGSIDEFLTSTSSS